MTPSFWFFLAGALCVVSAVIGLWLLGCIELTDEDALELEPEPLSISCIHHCLPNSPDWIDSDRRYSVVPDRSHWVRTRSEAVSLAVVAALTDFGRDEKHDNPYPLGAPLREIWGHHYERVTFDQMHAEAQLALPLHHARSGDMTAIVDAAQAPKA